MEKIGLNHKNSDFWTILRPMGNLVVYCVNWGGGKAVYSTLTVTFPWKKKIKKTVSSHRFAYMLHTKNFDLSSDMQVSHRCHNRRCVNIDHLSYEPPNVNQDRQICRGIFPTRCNMHAPYKDCLL